MKTDTELPASKTVAFLGPEGTFTQLAAMAHYGESCQLVACESIDDVFAKVEQGVAAYGMVPVENSTEGAINNTQDCLLGSDLTIVGEELVLIRHKLLAKSKVKLDQIQQVVSHKQSLAQCRQWLNDNLPAVSQLECSSNAQAAKQAAADETVAAIAGDLAARIYQLETLESDIQDQQHNSTRFLALGKTPCAASGNDKTSLIVYMEDKPGSLLRVLEPFEKLNINLSKIETRPSKKKAWAYVFFIDFDGHQDDEKTKELFGLLGERTVEIKILGSYPVA